MRVDFRAVNYANWRFMQMLYDSAQFLWPMIQIRSGISQYCVWLRTGRPDDRGSIPGRGERMFPLASVSRPALGLTQPPVQLVPGVLSAGIKRGRGVTLITHPIYCRGQEWVGAVSTLPTNASMACSGTALPFIIQNISLVCTALSNNQ
jgi:hypothetical protein